MLTQHTVSVEINNSVVATIDRLSIHPILGGSANNTGSVAFGGPQGYISLYRSLHVEDLDGTLLYHNDFLLADKIRTLDGMFIALSEIGNFPIAKHFKYLSKSHANIILRFSSRNKSSLMHN